MQASPVPDICFNCAYRERDLSRCWYLMTTDKINKLDGNKCKHFVDRKILDAYIREHLKIESKE